MTLLVAGILLGLGVPNLMEFQRNGLMTAAANNVVTAVMMARTEAVKRQAFVTWCLSDDPQAATPVCSPGIGMNVRRGFIVWVDTNANAAVNGGEEILTRGAVPADPLRVSTNCGHAMFAPSGFTRQSGTLCFPTQRAVLFCDDRGRRMAAGTLSTARVVLTNQIGRGQVLSDTAAVDTWAASFAAVCPLT